MIPIQPETLGAPFYHTQTLKPQRRQLIGYLGKDAGRVTEPKAQAPFETSAEVLTGLVKVFADYEQTGEQTWRTDPVVFRWKERNTHASRR